MAGKGIRHIPISKGDSEMRKLVVFALVVVFVLTSVSLASASPTIIRISQEKLLETAKTYGYTVGWHASNNTANKNNIGLLFLTELDQAGLNTAAMSWRGVQMISKPHSYIMTQDKYNTIVNWMKKHDKTKH